MQQAFLGRNITQAEKKTQFYHFVLTYLLKN